MSKLERNFEVSCDMGESIPDLSVVVVRDANAFKDSIDSDITGKADGSDVKNGDVLFVYGDPLHDVQRFVPVIFDEDNSQSLFAEGADDTQLVPLRSVVKGVDIVGRRPSDGVYEAYVKGTTQGPINEINNFLGLMRGFRASRIINELQNRL